MIGAAVKGGTCSSPRPRRRYLRSRFFETRSSSHHLHDLRHLQLALVHALQDDRLEARVRAVRFQTDDSVSPSAILGRLLFTLVHLHRIAAAMLGVSDVTVLCQEHATLAGAGDGMAEQAVSPVRNAAVHGFANDLCDEHAFVQPAVRDLNPADLFGYLSIAERSRRGFEVIDWNMPNEGLSLPARDQMKPRLLPNQIRPAEALREVAESFIKPLKPDRHETVAESTQAPF